MKSSRLPTLLASVICLTCLPPFAAANSAAASKPVKPDLESIVHEAYANNTPGAAVIVVHEGKILYRGARGLANLELAVPLRPEHVFRIGSITKQFTAAAILLLADEDRLALA